MLEGNGLNVSKGKLRNWRKAMGMDPDVDNFNLEALESMMNVSLSTPRFVVEEGRDKGDGTKWEDKNVIAKFRWQDFSLQRLPLHLLQHLEEMIHQKMMGLTGISKWISSRTLQTRSTYLRGDERCL